MLSQLKHNGGVMTLFVNNYPCDFDSGIRVPDICEFERQSIKCIFGLNPLFNLMCVDFAKLGCKRIFCPTVCWHTENWLNTKKIKKQKSPVRSVADQPVTYNRFYAFFTCFASFLGNFTSRNSSTNKLKLVLG